MTLGFRPIAFAAFLAYVTDGSASLVTNALPDGSIVKIEAVSYGIVHRIPSRSNWPFFFKSASPTVMFTTSRQAPPGHTLDEPNANGMWTRAEALDPSGAWRPPRRRVEARPVSEGINNSPPGYLGEVPTEMWETWEFPRSPEPSPWLRVRIMPWGESNSVNSLEFSLPNDEAWREQSAQDQLKTFHPQEWLNTQLIEATMENDGDYVTNLISQGADPNWSDPYRVSALSMACYDGHVKIVSYLLDHGAKVNAHDLGQMRDLTALMEASSKGDHTMIGVVKLLVDRGADVNIRGENGWTALIWAARAGNIEIVKYLLSKGADPHIKSSGGQTVVELTLESENTNNRSELIKLLKDALAAH